MRVWPFKRRLSTDCFYLKRLNDVLQVIEWQCNKNNEKFRN